MVANIPDQVGLRPIVRFADDCGDERAFIERLRQFRTVFDMLGVDLTLLKHDQQVFSGPASAFNESDAHSVGSRTCHQQSRADRAAHAYPPAEISGPRIWPDRTGNNGPTVLSATP
ncbi:hypothetical protein BH23CHL2_BH23CHL2_23330 [soil metagenome]